MLLSQEKRKPFAPRQAFEEDIWKHFVGGCLSTISFFSPMGIQLKTLKDHQYLLISWGDVTKEQLEDLIGNKKDKKFEFVDKYFE